MLVIGTLTTVIMGVVCVPDLSSGGDGLHSMQGHERPGVSELADLTHTVSLALV